MVDADDEPDCTKIGIELDDEVINEDAKALQYTHL